MAAPQAGKPDAAPVPWRALGAEPLEHNGYKLPLFKGLIAEQLEALAPR